MNPTELTSRVTLETGGLVAALALLAGALSGLGAAAGVCAGGALALANFRWLSGRVVAVTAGVDGGAPSGGWAIALGLRLATLGAAAAVLMASGWAHPVGVVVGLTALPCTLVRLGLAQARPGS